MTIIRIWAAPLIAMLGAGTVNGANAESRPVIVLELFTSQGCSSCPPADALLKRYIGREGVVAVSFPVDYWDRLGWKDTFASAANTKRQYAYAAARGDGQVYTPQVVVNGGAHLVGSSAARIDAAMAKAAEALAKDAVALSIEDDGAAITVSVGAAVGSTARRGKLLIGAVKPVGEVSIGAGENEGRKVAYHNVVRSLVEAGTWSGAASSVGVLKRELGWKPADSVIALLQQDDGTIVGAAQLTAAP
ncbi:MAG: DUF1223 domain-containing protein [Hyphomicrobiales bacterium]|nr:DUF1223 domain-containing protein [Hyphomicrobiales bacterium]